MKKYYILVYSSRSATDRIILFLNLKKNVKSLDIFLATSLIPIKQFDILEPCQLSLFPNSSFELNRVEAYPK